MSGQKIILSAQEHLFLNKKKERITELKTHLYNQFSVIVMD